MTVNARDGEAFVPLDDRGLNYGDGLFETMRTAAGRIPLLDGHLQRLIGGCQRLRIPIPDPGTLRAAADSAATGLDDGVVKLLVTRGGGGRGYRPPEAPSPRILVSVHEAPDAPRDWYREGVRVRICQTRIGRSRATAGLKHLGRLEQVLASAELEADETEGLMLDENDLVIEGTRCNLFIVKGDGLMTPPVDMSGVAGVMRALVRNLALRTGLECREEAVGLDELRGAREILLTNSVLGVLPVTRIPSLNWRRNRGPVTEKLMQSVAEMGVEAWAP
jgi:4-amino-4-deoxychorismate lyase